jgi:hypothetical protein
MLNAYKEILSYFGGSETMKKGSLTTYNHNDILFFQKSFSLETVLVLVNVRNNAKTLAIPAELQNTDWTDVFSNQSVTLGSQVDLSSFNYMVLKK